MRKLVVSMFISLDGVVQAPGGVNEDPSGDFRLGGWMVPYFDPAIGQHVNGLMDAPFDLLLGRNTYDIFAGHWPGVPADADSHPLALRMNQAGKYVATHRPGTLAWQGSHALAGELADAVRALKRQGDANLITFGSGDMVRQLLAAGLVDELCLLVYPLMLGRGKRLFDERGRASAFTLAQSASTPGGVLITRYLPAGEVRTGAFDEPA